MLSPTYSRRHSLDSARPASQASFDHPMRPNPHAPQPRSQKKDRSPTPHGRPVSDSRAEAQGTFDALVPAPSGEPLRVGSIFTSFLADSSGGPLTPLLQPGQLVPTLARRSQEALASGALQPIATALERIDDAGLCFLVRVVDQLAQKAAALPRRKSQPIPFNPFLPPDPGLTLGGLCPTHTAVLNKFNVLDEHLLIITNQFEHQDTLLNPADFEALAIALRELDGLAFYNRGEEAGASEAHKHLQLVPLPLVAGEPKLPVEMLFSAGDGIEVKNLPFRHAWRPLPAGLFAASHSAAQPLLRNYRDMLDQCGIDATEGPQRHSAPYNLLVRRSWMMLIPRARERWQGISINALGFAGSLFVPDAAGLAQIRRAGPMQVLLGVTP